MAEFNKHKNFDYSKFEKLSTEELEEILHLDSQLSEDEQSNMDAILYIMEVVAARKKEHFTDVDSAWKTFNEKYRPSAGDIKSLYEYEDDATNTNDPYGHEPIPFKAILNSPTKRRTRSILRVACVAAAIVALTFATTIMAYALGYDLWGTVAQWSKETFGFTYTTNSEQERDIPSQSAENVGAYADLQSALDGYGITEKLAPKYIPEEYEQTEFYADDESENTHIVSGFEKDDKTIIVKITKNEVKVGSKYQKDEGDPEIYKAGGIDHYIMTNMGKYAAVWVNDGFECGISGLATKDELIKMINSIYDE